MSLILTPGGVVNTDREEVALPPEFLEMIGVFGNVAGDLGWGLHCTRCQQDLKGSNARQDRLWKLDCGCRSYVGRNPGHVR